MAQLIQHANSTYITGGRLRDVLSQASSSAFNYTTDIMSRYNMQRVLNPKNLLAMVMPAAALNVIRAHETCSTTAYSCQTTYTNQDTCCFNYPGGQLVQTQFWDTDPVAGPSNSWTIHGLW